MGSPKLSEAQKLQLIQWLGEGLTTEQINEQAATFDPPFRIIPSMNTYYRNAYRDEIKAIREEVTERVFGEGLALAKERVRRLYKLAEVLEADLHDRYKVWLKDVKGIGSGEQFERVEFEQFNAAEIKELRAIYDDIAKETGGRINRVDVTTKGKEVKTYVGVSPDDWDADAPDKTSGKDE